MRQWRNGRRATLRGWSGQPGVGSSPTCRTYNTIEQHGNKDKEIYCTGGEFIPGTQEGL